MVPLKLLYLAKRLWYTTSVKGKEMLSVLKIENGDFCVQYERKHALVGQFVASLIHKIAQFGKHP